MQATCTRGEPENRTRCLYEELGEKISSENAKSSENSKSSENAKSSENSKEWKPLVIVTTAFEK